MNDKPVDYMPRTRDYYAAQGYEKPYRWAHFDDIPFAPLAKPLAQCTATIVTTAMHARSYAKPYRRLYIGDLSSPPTSFYTDDLAWDKDATHTNDVDTFFPAKQLTKRVADGELGALAAHYYCVPTTYSQRQATARDAPRILESCQQDGVDVALLVPL